MAMDVTLRQLRAYVAVLEAAIAGLLEHHQGHRAVRALPGIGPVPRRGDRAPVAGGALWPDQGA